METATSPAVFLISLSLILIVLLVITYMVGKHEGSTEVELKLFGLRLSVKRNGTTSSIGSSDSTLTAHPILDEDRASNVTSQGVKSRLWRLVKMLRKGGPMDTS